MSRPSKKFHFIYKTTNLTNNTHYIGMHSTDNLNDGYIGSGKRLWYSIRKYGKDQHQFQILEFLPDRKSLSEREKQLVSMDQLNDPLCLNLMMGGDGGWEAHNADPENRKHRVRGAVNANRSPKRDHKSSVAKAVETKRARGVLNKSRNNGWSGKKHSDTARQKMSESARGKQDGEKNSQFGTCWIFNVEEKQSKKIRKDDLESWIAQGWTKGRKSFK